MTDGGTDDDATDATDAGGGGAADSGTASTIAAELRDEIARKVPVDERERRSIDDVVRGLERLEHPFDIDADPVHVTASAIVVGPRGLVLHRHRVLGRWLQPGGHIDSGETPWEAARRETLEETGLVAEFASGPGRPPVLHVDAHAGPRGHTHLDVRYLLVAPDVDPTPPPEESQDCRWFSWDEAATMPDDGLTGIVRALSAADRSSVVIRPASDIDAAQVAELYLRSRRHALPTVAVVHDDEDVRAWVASTLVRRAGTWVAVLAGVPVAVLSLDLPWVDQLYVDPPWIGRGTGSLLVDHAKRLHPDGLELWTFQVNTPARAFYARHGFVEMEETDGAANEEGEPDVRLRWSPRA